MSDGHDPGDTPADDATELAGSQDEVPQAPAPGRVPTPQSHFASRFGGLKGAIAPLITTLIAFMMGGLVVILTGKNPIKVYHAIWNGTGTQVWPDDRPRVVLGTIALGYGIPLGAESGARKLETVSDPFPFTILFMTIAAGSHHRKAGPP